jgi:glycerol-3-phosphate acyltransferase PlsY
MCGEIRQDGIPRGEVFTLDEPWVYALWAIGAYLVGSIPAGEVVARIKRIDIRSAGTGNPGAANVYREVGPAYGVAVFSFDCAKGAAATLPLFLIGAPASVAAIAMGSVLAGHFFPVPWRSVGGTGMVVVMGSTLGLLPAGAMIAAVPSVLCIRLTRNSGFTGALFFTTAIVSGWLVHRDEVAAVAVLLGAVAISLKALVQYRG